MNNLFLCQRVLGCCMPIALFSGCAASEPPIATPVAAPRDASIARNSGSWMRPNTSKINALLYVSDGASAAIFVYDYKTSELVGKLRGLQHPYGECVDKRGNVWVADLAGQVIVRYPRGGISWTKRLETDGAAVGCSVDPTTGNVAASNVTTASGAGDIRIYAGSGFADYSNEDCYYLEQPGYDHAGNLYVEAYSASYVPYVCELPHGGTSLATVSVSHQIYGPGSVMWDGKYLVLTDELYNNSHSTAIYQTEESPSGNLGVVGTAVMTDTCDGENAEIWQPFVVGTRNTPSNMHQGHVVVGFDTDCPERHRLSFWQYPSGGNPSRAPRSQPKAPDGNVVSLAPR
jgi:hypothetical protein